MSTAELSNRARCLIDIYAPTAPLADANGNEVKSADGGVVCKCGCVCYHPFKLPPDLEAERQAELAKMKADGIVICDESASISVIYKYRFHSDCVEAWHWGHPWARIVIPLLK